MINKREKLIHLIYLILLFLITSGGTCWFLFRNYDFRTITQKDYVITKMDRVKEFQSAQQSSKLLVDSLYNKIKKYDPGLNAIYAENDIKFMINDLYIVYEKNNLDGRYKAFQHVSDFFKMFYEDKKILWYIKQDINSFKRQLEECEAGLSDKKADVRAIK